MKIGTRVKLVADTTSSKELESLGLIGELGTTTDNVDWFGLVNVKFDNGASDSTGAGFVVFVTELEVIDEAA